MRACPLLALLVLGGCALADPLVGEWTSPYTVDGHVNRMEVERDFEGDATIFAYAGDTLYELDFRLQVEDWWDMAYLLRLDSVDDSAFDLDMDCEMNDERDVLQCAGSSPWDGYPLEWERG